MSNRLAAPSLRSKAIRPDVEPPKLAPFEGWRKTDLMSILLPDLFL
jgi:hypothetical protein